MPKRLEKELVRGANRLHLSGDRRKAYIYGTLNKIKKQAKKGKSK